MRNLLEELEVKELLKEFDFVKEFDYVEFAELEDEDITWRIDPIFDDEENLVDLAAVAGSSYIRLSEEPDFWPYQNMRSGNWIAETWGY